MPRPRLRLALLALGFQPALALAGADTPDPTAPLTLQRAAPLQENESTEPLHRLMPEAFYLGDDCDHVEPSAIPAV